MEIGKTLIISADQYKSLNDAAKYIPSLAKGPVKIWYWKSEAGRDLLMGYEFLEKEGMLPDKNSLKSSYIELGSIKESKLEKIFKYMQGENWSPKGEARDLIRKKKLSHTSMSVGDIIEKGNKLFMVDRFGFAEIK